MSIDWTNPSNVEDAIRTLTREEQDPAIVETVFDRVKEILTSDENILYVAVQKKPVVNLSPDCAVLTNRRFIVYRPKLLGRVVFEDYVWRDLQEAKLQENVLGSTLIMKTTGGQAIALDYLPKKQARRLYAFAQEMEERTREERRARDLEEKRAAAGGVFVAGNAVPPASPNAHSDTVQRLKALKEMADAGLISAGEYEAKRAEIISKM